MPDATVAAIIIKENPNNKKLILLCKRSHNPFKGKWCIPGGHIENGEKAYNAVIREVKEETELDFEGEFFDVFDEILPDMMIHNIVIVYKGISNGQLPDRTDEVDEFIWISIDEAIRMDLAFRHNEIIHELSRRL